MFLERLDRQLIRLVKANPVLYDYHQAKYMDFNSREVAWQKIGDEMKKSAVDCKVRWINIRDVHRRIIKKTLNGLPGRPMKEYKYEKEMAFMRPFYKDVIIQAAAKHEEDDDDDDNDDVKTGQWENVICEETIEQDIPEVTYSDDCEKPIKKIKTKRRKYKKRKSTYDVVNDASTSLNDTQTLEFDPTDSVDAFLLSIGATLKTFTPYHLNIAKTKIFSVVQEHDLQQIVETEDPEHTDKVSASEADF